MTDQLLPLFLLDTVLFPTMQLPLQIFEPRYLEMIERCLATDSVFGINLIRLGVEAGGHAMPCSVGTTARIVSHERQQDGKIMLLARGERRYRIVRSDFSKDYLQAEVAFLRDEPSIGDLELGRQVMDRFTGVLQELGLRIEFNDELLEQPDQISYLVASHLQRDNLERQQLLETDSVLERLELERQWMEELLEAVKMRKKVEQVAGRNGKFKH